MNLLAYIPFVTPIPFLWNHWALLALPLTAAVSVVYKTIKCRYVREIPAQSAIIGLWIILSMIGVAAAVSLLYAFLTT